MGPLRVRGLPHTGRESLARGRLLRGVGPPRSVACLVLRHLVGHLAGPYLQERGSGAMNASIRHQLLREVATLPTELAGRVLDFVRWLKVVAEPDAELEARVDAALAEGRTRAGAAGLTDEDIAREIAEHRAHS